MYALFDIGGTKTRVAFSPDGATFSEPVIFATEKNFDTQIQKMRDAVPNAVQAVVGGLAGTFDEGKNKLITSPHISEWINEPFREKLESVFGAPASIENDAALVGLGEAVAGAGRESRICAYITVSTGVGGVRIIDKKIDENIFGFEPGHMIIDLDESVCPTCHDKGHLEGLTAGTALQKKTGMHPKDVTDTKIWEEEARLLAAGLNNVAVMWSPEVIVLGGAMIVGSPCIPIDHIKHHFDELLKIFPIKPKIKKAELGHIGGIHGALHYAQSIKK